MKEVSKEVEKEVVKEPKTTMNIPITFAQELIGYLQTRPWTEVNGIINKLLMFSQQK